MLKLGSLKLGTNPRVAVSFSDRVKPADIAKARKAGVDIAEARIDLFRSFEPKYVAKKLSLFKGMPVIATIRLKREGGVWDGSEIRRRTLFELALPYADAIDIELDSKDTLRVLGSRVRKRGKLLIVSHHDCATTPNLAALKKIIAAAEKAGADIVKIATTIKKSEHIEVLAALLTGHKRKNLIVTGMGGAGVITRILFPCFGSLVTYAYAGNLKAAPGQLPYAKMIELLLRLAPARRSGRAKRARRVNA